MDEDNDGVHPAPSPAAPVQLVVTESFLGYQRGEVIADADRVREVLDGEHASHVVKRAG